MIHILGVTGRKYLAVGGMVETSVRVATPNDWAIQAGVPKISATHHDDFLRPSGGHSVRKKAQVAGPDPTRCPISDRHL